MERQLRAGPWIRALALLALAAPAGCDDGGGSAGGDAGADADADTDTDGDADADAGADAGADGGAFCDRGAPEEFPAECLATCEEACARLDECGGATAPGCPLTAEACAAACALGMAGGHSWDDVTGHFRCCAAQEECADVAGCGGWLAHPDAVEPCGQYCDCWEAATPWGALGAAQAPPPGYQWAPGYAAILPGAASTDYEALYGVPAFAPGGVVLLRAATGCARRAALARRLLEEEVALPTLVDAAGRLAIGNGNVVIRAADPAAVRAARAVVAGRGFARVRELGWSGGDLRVAEGGDPWGALDALAALNAVPGVRAELDMIRVYRKLYTPDDPMFPDQWHLLNGGQDDPGAEGGPPLSVAGNDARVTEAWDVTMGDAAVAIAILDDGVNLTHPDLTPNELPAQNYPEDWEAQLDASFTASGGSPYYYLSGHGTACASVAAGRGDNGIGLAGVCPLCSLQPALFWDPALGAEGLPTSGGFMVSSDTAQATLFTDLVDVGAAIISNSWGPAGEDPEFEGSVGANPALSTVMQAAFDYAESDGRGGLGTLIVFAAGNSNYDVSDDTYVAPETVVGVAAVDDQGLKSWYSSFGSSVDVAAPSNGGMNGITAAYSAPDAAENPQYRYDFGGTSSATPFVAGVLGLILSADPTLTAAAARQILTDSATAIDPVWGEWADGFSPFYGHGLVNAYRAVQLATGACVDPAACFAPSDECAADCDGTACAACRTDNDCADGWACQALPALGAAVCVEAVAAAGDCGAGFAYTNGYCLPSRDACGLCGDAELCNGRDDDCDGVVSEDMSDCYLGTTVSHPYRCLQDGAGCPADYACAATICETGTFCVDASSCGTGEQCVHVKTRYGDIDAAVGLCLSVPVPTTCGERCLVRDSSGVDAEMAAFADCALGLVDDCTESTVQVCRELLPDGA